MREYGGGLRLCHIDAYRLSGGEEAVFAGLAEHIGAPDAVCVIEWYQNIASVLPQKGARRIEISRSLCADSDDAREIIFE
jgi:tRNA A37 threonylcarbamoyladenosine biosynthesis protein TsaE